MGRSVGRIKALKGFSAPLRSRSRARPRPSKGKAEEGCGGGGCCCDDNRRGCAAETATTGATDTQRECSFAPLAYHSYRSIRSITSRSSATNVMQMRGRTLRSREICGYFRNRSIASYRAPLCSDNTIVGCAFCASNPCCLLSANSKNDYANCVPRSYSHCLFDINLNNFFF